MNSIIRSILTRASRVISLSTIRSPKPRRIDTIKRIVMVALPILGIIKIGDLGIARIIPHPKTTHLASVATPGSLSLSH